MNKYLPEGTLITTLENQNFISSVRGLEKALVTGKILEAMAIMCDSELNITVELGEIYGVIPKKEALYNDSEIKDIAVITRIGKPVCFKVIGFDKDKNGKLFALLSRRAAQAECMNSYVMSLSAGDIIDVKTTHLERFGAFVDIGCGIISLLTIDAISVSRISHPRDRLYVGMNLKTVVKSIDYLTGRVYVSLKELLGTWEENAAEFHIGQTVAGTIRSVEDYGVFIELSPNLTGLAESESDLEVGQSAAVYIKNIIPERMKVKLVIVDVSENERVLKEPKYYLQDKTHIDRWVYSPASSKRVIETVFNEQNED